MAIRKVMRISALMEQVPIQELERHIGKIIWHAPTTDGVVHGPFELIDTRNGLALMRVDEKPLLIDDIRLNTFWVIA